MSRADIAECLPGASTEVEESEVTIYSVFTKWEKRYIVGLVALSGWFSTLSGFIFYPVIGLIARDLHTSISRINLTVTSYLVVSGIAPAIMGDAADMLGRRPLYIITLTIYMLANMGIALQRSFTALLVLRMLQSAGISGTFSIAYGVIADISTPAERGSYVGALSFGITTAPSFGPIIGGAIGYSISWRWIFWFLCITSGSVLLAMTFTLPETNRELVGNGDAKAPLSSQLPVSCIKKRSSPNRLDNNEIPARQVKFRVPNPINCLRLLLDKDTAVTVFAGGILYTTYCCLHASLSSLFIKIYDLNQLHAGLIYLPFGIGGTISTLMSSKMIDRDYVIIANLHGLPTKKFHGDDLNKFPIEEARLRSVSVALIVTVISVIGYGWTLESKTHIAIPLLLQFITGFTIQTCFNVHNTLLIDINQKAPATAQAANNVIRCSIAAGAVAGLQPLTDSVGVGWTFTFFGSLCLVSAGLYFLERRYGMTWRLERTGAVEQPITQDNTNGAQSGWKNDSA